MKKILQLTFILFVAATLKSAGQAVNITTGNVNFSGDVNTILTAHVTVENQSANTLNVWAARTVNTLATGHKSYFCFAGLCYGFSTNLSSNPDTIAPFGSDNFFSAYLNPFGNVGQSSVCYNFYNHLNPADSASICFNYDVTLTGINDHNAVSSLSVPSPNPADHSTFIGYNLSGNNRAYEIAIYNVLGNLVKKVSLPYSSGPGAILISTAELKSGVYFYSLVSGNKVLNTSKLIVVHKN
jgi:hypothetical protein